MARARSPNSIEAEKMYRSGMKLVDIAKKMEVPEGTVRRWKSTQKWDDKGKRKSERSEKKEGKKKANVRKPGPPKGNKNAEGSGAPDGNKNALKHGGYSAVYWDVLSDEEREMIEETPSSEEVLLMEQIQLFAVRERRLMKAINKYTEAKGGQYVSGVMSFEEKRKFKTPEEEENYKTAVQEKVKKGERLPGEWHSIQTSTGAAIDLVARLERELTSVQSKKTKAIDSLIRLRIENRKLDEAGKGNELVDDWIASIMGEDQEGGGDE